MIGLLGRKVGMTQIFDEEGLQRGVTVLEVGPCYIADIKNKERDGYQAVQLAYKPAKEKGLNRAKLGQLKKAGIPVLRILREIRTDELEGLKVGAELCVDNFSAGEYVDVQGISIGRGFQGVVKRHHFKGGEAAHGAKFGRESGSIGQGKANPSRVPKGRRMAGHMGTDRITIQNLKIMRIDPENNLMLLKGTVPGSEDGVLIIRSALKKISAKKWKVAGAPGTVPEAEASQEEKAPQKKTKSDDTGKKS